MGTILVLSLAWLMRSIGFSYSFYGSMCDHERELNFDQDYILCTLNLYYYDRSDSGSCLRSLKVSEWSMGVINAVR